MKDVIIHCKQFEEWDKETQDIILNKHSHINVEDNWWDWIYEGIEEDLEKLGYEDIEISFTGFWSQGDGASFIGNVDVKKWIEANNKDKYRRILKLINSPSRCIDPYGYIKRDRWGHYVHWNTTSLYIDWNIDYPVHGGKYSNIESLIEELEADIFSHHQELNKEIYRRLEDGYNALTSDEVVKRTLIANEYEFDESGKIW